MNKRILFLSYWNLREPLTAAAVFPYLQLLSARPDVERILLVTLETTDLRFQPDTELDIPKVEHLPVFPRRSLPYMLSKVELLLRAQQILTRLVRRENINLIFAKASLAGTLADVVHWRTGVPYNVESYEPHSTYMVDCGEWPRNGLRHRFARYFEKRQLAHAQHVITVTNNHREDLIAEGYPPERIRMIPSITDLERFKFRPEQRARVRRELGLSPDDVVGIYVGKFGGLYFDEEAFQIFRRMADHFPDPHILVLSPMDPELLRRKARHAGIPDDRFHVMVVPHTAVPDHLSAADIAFSTIKPAAVKRYQCPIKNGEYWANGLPILMTDGIADDHLLMRQGLGGQVFSPDLHDLDRAYEGLRRIMEDPGHRQAIAGLARTYKSLDIARSVYADIF